MSDRFDHTFEHKLERKPDGSREAAVTVRRIELITGTGWRRRWPPDVKARILLESLEAGTNISEVARRNGLTPQQLFGWRHQAQMLNGRGAGALEGPSLPGPSALAPQLRPKRGRPRLDRSTGQPTVPCAGQAPAPVFAPVVIGAPPASAPAAPVATTLPGTIEIVVGDITVRVGGQIDAQHIATVLRAVRRSS